MKILMTVFDINDFGGIVHRTEIIAKAYREMGHDVTLVKLMDTSRAQPYLNQEFTNHIGAHKSVLGKFVHTLYGWYGIMVYGYRTKEQRKIWRKFANTFDVVFYQVPVPPIDPHGAWKKVYQLDTKQVLAVPDAHCRDRYPYLLDICNRLEGAGTTHEAGYIALSAFPIRRAYIGSPHIPMDWDQQRSWTEREPQFVSAHVWKALKNMDRLVRAFPFMRDVPNIVAGDGIEGRYMRSPHKCPPKYRGIWKKAERNGMEWTNMLSPRDLRRAYLRSRVMVDLAYNKKYAAYGNSHNRSLFDGYNAGCVPLVFEEAMTESTDAALFENGVTHIGISHESTPKEVAKAILAAIKMKPKRARDMVEAGRELITKHFDYRAVAQSYLDLADPSIKRIGLLGRVQRGGADVDVQALRDEYMNYYAEHGRPIHAGWYKP